MFRKLEWGDPSPNYSITVEKQIPTSTGTIQVVSFSSAELFSELFIAYYIVWKSKLNTCFTSITDEYIRSYFGYNVFEISDLKESVQSGIYQLTLDSARIYLDSNGETISTYATRTISFFDIDSTKGPQILVYQIPVLDSGSGTQRKKKLSSLQININNTGLVNIKKGIGSLTKKQLQWIGTFQLANTNSSSILPPITNIISISHAKATALFKSGDPNAAADTLAKAIPLTSILTPATIPIANDLGFFLVEAKRYLEGAKVLESVLAADSNRTVAYLNLGDAYAGAGKTGEARQNYRKYCDRMDKAGKGGKIPPRIKVMLTK